MAFSEIRFMSFYYNGTKPGFLLKVKCDEQFEKCDGQEF